MGLRNKVAVGQSVLRAATAITIRQNSPFDRCFTCLARQLMVTETMVREVAHVLVVRDGFALDQRICCTCQRVEDLVVPTGHVGSSPPAIPRLGRKQGELQEPERGAEAGEAAVGGRWHPVEEILRARDIRALARDLRTNSQRLRAELRRQQGIQDQRTTSGR
jgi:hypothetical protein